MKKLVCNTCGKPAKIGPVGYIHESGSSTILYCEKCGWKGSTLNDEDVCPNCGNKNLEIDHEMRIVRRKD